MQMDFLKQNYPAYTKTKLYLAFFLIYFVDQITIMYKGQKK